jgi:uncharacterized membrane protein YeaQ/YmgE (transglycosylase-associated protein family)
MNPSYGIIIWLIIGALAGWIGSKIMGTDARQGWVANVFIGIVGAVVGGYLARVLFGYSSDSNNGLLMSFFVALAGACLVIFAWTAMSRRRA